MVHVKTSRQADNIIIILIIIIIIIPLHDALPLHPAGRAQLHCLSNAVSQLDQAMHVLESQRCILHCMLSTQPQVRCMLEEGL